MLKEEAENSISQKEALAMSVSDISHQLKTPLTSVLILLDNLSQSDNMDKVTREKFISEIARQIEGMNWIVISLLKLSRLDAGVVDFSNIKIDANKLIENILSNLEIMAELKNVSFKVENIRKEKAYFNGDYNWNKEAIQNIIKNAIEHTKENLKVTIQIEENDVYTSISITHEGNGISAKDLKHIFDRFYKSENSSENSFGIGLSLSKSIIEKQNGYIGVETKEGKGTSFKVKYIKIVKITIKYWLKYKNNIIYKQPNCKGKASFFLKAERWLVFMTSYDLIWRLIEMLLADKSKAEEPKEDKG